MSGDWLMGARSGVNYDWSMTMVVDPPDHGRALATTKGTSSAGHLFIAVHRKQPGERLRDRDLPS